ncbi:glycine zipper 2TM domain-containing protein [Roseicella aquatilis]|uniref:glycine zipper 2TM domain-containing protein n=1 Tax=Roseicella aquatilis TaxID=2527868 RepID=UPI0024C1ACF4|nr:glycine zipper 2TM domain-containing protein [Roseicella aquatilis]
MSRLPACLLAFALIGCGERYSPDTYATRAVQQANRVEPGVVIGVRRVQISAEGSTGAAAGAAAGGVLGAQTPGGGIGQALGGVGGALVGGLIGRAAESAAVDTPAHEYVVRTEKEELLSVTQKDSVPLAVGQRVLVITGNQARIVPDYTVAAARPVSAAMLARQERDEAPPRPAPEPATDPAAAAAAGVIQQSVPAPPGPPVLVPPPPALRPGAALPSVIGPVAAALAAEAAERRD